MSTYFSFVLLYSEGKGKPSHQFFEDIIWLSLDVDSKLNKYFPLNEKREWYIIAALKNKDHACMCVTIMKKVNDACMYNWCLILTKKTASLAAIATISAHETTPAHCFSSCSFTSSIISYPLKLKFAGESFSAVLPLVESIKTDASHPCHNILRKILVRTQLINESNFTITK